MSDHNDLIDAFAMTLEPDSKYTVPWSRLTMEEVKDVNNKYCGTCLPYPNGSFPQYCKQKAEIPVLYTNYMPHVRVWVCRDCFKAFYLNQYLFTNHILAG